MNFEWSLYFIKVTGNSFLWPFDLDEDSIPRPLVIVILETVQSIRDGVKYVTEVPLWYKE